MNEACAIFYIFISYYVTPMGHNVPSRTRGLKHSRGSIFVLWTCLMRFFICYSLQNYRIRQGRNDLNSIHLHDDTAYYPCVDIITTGSSLSPENDSSQKDIRGYSLTQTLLHTSVLRLPATKHCPQLKDILRIWGHQGNTFGHDLAFLG